MSEKFLKRVLGLGDVIGIEIGTTIGAGVFVWTGIAMTKTGSALPLSYLIAVIPIIFAMVPIAMLGSAIPTVGGNYKYPSRLLSPFIAFIAVWAYILGAFAGFFPLYAINIVEYLNRMFPEWHISGMEIKFIAAGIIFFFYIINLLGAKTSSKIQIGMIIIMLLGLLLYSLIGLPKVEASHFSGFFNKGTSGILIGASLLTFTYMGSNSIIELGGEIKNPGKIIPKSLLISFPIIIIIYLLVSIVSTGVLPWEEVAGKPLTESASVIFGQNFFFYFFCVSALLALTTTLNASFIWGTKSLIILCDDGILPAKLAGINQKFSTPHYILTLVALISIIIIFIDIDQFILTSYATIGGMTIFIPVLLTAFILPTKWNDIYNQAKFKPNKLFLRFCTIIGLLLALAAIINLLMEGLMVPSNSNFTSAENNPVKYSLYLAPKDYNPNLENKILVSTTEITESFSISEGDNYTFSEEVFIPDNFPYGTYYMFIDFNISNNPVELNTNNNLFSNMEEIYIASDIIQTDLSVSNFSINNETASLSIQSSKPNYEKTEIPISIEYLNVKREFSIFETFMILLDFNPDNTCNIDFPLHIPENIPDGKYDIKAMIMPENDAITTNNTGTVQNISVNNDIKDFVKLSVQSISENKIKIEIENENPNEINAVEINADLLFYSENSSDRELFNYQISDITESNNYEYIIDINSSEISSKIPSGTYNISFISNCIIDFDSEERSPVNITNKELSFDSFTISSQNLFPDLEIIDLNIPYELNAGQNFTANFSTYNKPGKNYKVFIIFLVWVAVGVIYYFVRIKMNKNIRNIYRKNDF